MRSNSAVLKVEEARGADAVPGSNLVANWPLTKANRKKKLNPFLAPKRGFHST